MSELSTIANMIAGPIPPAQNVNYQGGPAPFVAPRPLETDVPVPEAPATKLFKFRIDGVLHKIRGPADGSPEEAFKQLRASNPAIDRAATAAENKEDAFTILKHVASYGTGTARGIAATGTSFIDLPQAVLPSPLGNVVSAGAKKVYDISSPRIQPWLEEHLYKPETPGERITAATGAGAVAGLSKNPVIAVSSAAGGALAQLLHELPGGATGTEWLDKAIGKVGLPAAGMIAQVAPQLIGWGLHAAGLGKLGHLVDSMMSRFGPSGERAAIAAETDPRKIIALEQSGQISSEEADQMFKARRQEMLGPDAPAHDIYNPSLSEALGPTATMIAKLLRTFVASPEVQYQATKQYAPQPDQSGTVLP